MNELKIFENPEFGVVRAVELDGEPWLVLADVCRVLELTNPSKVASRLDEDEKQQIRFDPNSGLGLGHNGATIVSESGLYKVILRSDKPGAKKFTRWVTHEVLPAIRKTGGYLAGQEALSPQELMAKALQWAQRTLDEREARISDLTVKNTILQPKADYFDELVNRNLLTGMYETAKQLCVPPKQFTAFLIEHKYLYRDKKGKLMPYADKNNGLFELKECYNEKTEWKGTQTMITPKGRETFRLLCRGLIGTPQK